MTDDRERRLLVIFVSSPPIPVSNPVDENWTELSPTTTKTTALVPFITCKFFVVLGTFDAFVVVFIVVVVFLVVVAAFWLVVCDGSFIELLEVLVKVCVVC